MRGLRDLLLWGVLGALYVVVVAPLLRVEDGVVVVWVGGGLAAGLLVCLPRERWWPLLVAAAGVSVGSYLQLDMPIGLLVVQSGLDLLAILSFATIITRHRRGMSGLGADVPWVALAGFSAAGIRLIGFLVELAVLPTELPRFGAAAGVEVALSTLIGVVAGTGTVLGLARWPRRSARLVEHREQILGAAVLVSVLILIFLSPFGTAIPGSEYLIVPLLLASAVRYPVPLTATLNGLTVVVVSMAVALGTGAFDFGVPATPEQVFESQMFLLVVIVSVFVLASVVSERRKAEDEIVHSSSLLAAVFRESPVPAAWLTITPDGYPVIREANPVFLSLVGLADEEVSGIRLSSLLSPSHPISLAALESGRDVQAFGPDGTIRWLRPTLSRTFTDPAVEGDEPTEAFAVLVLEDVTADRVSEELLRQQARRDSLTGLPNRAALVERLDEAIDAAVDAPVGLLIIDIDDLKVVNNGLGHLAGDQLIIQMAERFVDVIAPRDFLVRTGGDEFAVLRPHPRDDDTLDDLAQRILHSVEEPFTVDSRSVPVSVSIGAAESDASTELPGDLLRSADIALQRAKHSGRHQAARFEPGDDRPARERMGFEHLLRRALDEDDLVCLYQPIVLASTSRVVAAETLVRLRADDGSLVPPSSFLPLAAELGLLGRLTDQVLRQACAAARRWRDMGHEIRVAFNAPPQWLTAEAIDTVDRLVAEYALPMSILTVEVTEEETLSAGRGAIETLTELRSRGMNVAIDDFGTGYAGLDSFRSVPANIVKVDRSFVDEMLRNDEDYELVRSMLDLVYRFGKLAVAEGVEDDGQLQALRAMGCEYAQGFHLSRPVPLEEFPAGLVLPSRTQPGRLPVSLPQ